MDKMLKLYKIVDGTEVAFPNDSEQLLLSSFDYSSQRMGNAPIITGTIMHGKCLDDYFNEIKPQEVFIVFNEERYYLKNTPTSSFSNTDARYKHDVEFVSERIKLSNVYFYDVVSSDVENDKPVSNSSVVTFSGNIREFAARLNYSLQYAKLQTVSDDGVVSGYNVVVDDDVSADEYKLVSFSNQYFEAVLQQTFELYGVPYYFKGKTIHFGWTDADSVINETLKYGKDNSLLSITKSNTNNQIINRCTGTGSADNISFYYPNNSELGELEYTLKDNKGNVLNDDFFVKNYNVLAKSVEVGTTYQYYDTTNYIDMEVLGAYFCKKEGDSPTTAWERISYGDDHVSFNTYINIKTYGGVVVPTFHHYRIDFKIKAEATVNLTFKAGVTTPTQDGSQFFFDLSDARFVRLFKGEYSPTNYAIRTLKTSGDNISFHLEEPDVYSLEVFDIDVTKIYPTLNNASCALMFFNVKNISAEDRTQEWRNEKGHTFRNLKKVGLTGDETKVPFGSTLSTKVLFRVAPQPNLMPYIYRESRGNERFYNAENNKYLDENNEYYEFANTYIESSPKEHIQQFEDIKPSIEGVVNNAGLPINVFTEFAYDENDNDEMDGENFKHPYFYGKLRKMDGKFGLNIFDYASEEGEMTISMIDGSCAACQFKIGVDSSTNKNIVQVDENGNLKRDANGDVIRFGSPQDVQNDTKNNEVWVALMKDKDTFNTLMPNATLKPSVGDKFVILHIELPREYVWAAEQKLTDAIIKHMAENNDEKFKFSIKFSRIYLAENPDVLKRLSENSTIRFEYNGVEYFYYVSSFSYRFKSDEALPEINVELSDTITADKNTFEKAFRQVNTNVVYMQQQTIREVSRTISATTIPSNEDSTNTGVTDFVNGVKVSGDLISDLIKSNDVVPSSDDKIYTSKTVDEKIKNALENASVSGDFLSKTKEDVAQKKIVFKEGVGIGNAVILWDEEQGGLHIQKFDGTPAGLWTDSYLSAKGANPNTGGSSEDGATTLGGLRNVAADADRTYDVAKMLVLEAKSNLWSLKNLSELVGGLDEAELAEYLTNNNYAKKSDIPSLSGYATEQWVLGKGYATTSDLDSRIDALVNGAPAAYDTLKEIADVLAGNVNSISDILTALGNKADKAATLGGYGITDAYTITQIDSIVNGLSGNISTLQGYFTDGVANSALKLSDNGSYTAWGQTFFTNGKPKSVSGALTDVTDITSSGTITTNKIIIGNGTIEWDETNKGFKVTGLYSTTYLSAKGANSSGGSSSGGGLITSLYRYSDLGKTFSDTSNDTFNAYTINKINADLGSRISVLEGKATNVSFTQSLTSGTQIGTITIDGASKNIYAPTIPTNLSQFTDDVVSGKYLPLSGGTIDGTIIFKDNSGIWNAHNDGVLGIHVNGWDGVNSYSAVFGSPSFPTILRSSENVKVYYGGNSYSIIHSGNIGSQSVANTTTIRGWDINIYNGKPFGGIPIVANAGNMIIGRYLDFYYNNNSTSDYSTRLQCPDTKYVDVTLPNTSGTLALLTDNVASATKLQTARSIWGQSFDGTGNVSGVLSGANQISFDSGISYGIFRGNFFTTSLSENDIAIYNPTISLQGNVGILNSKPNYTLDISGTLYASDVATFNKRVYSNIGFLFNGDYGIWCGGQYTGALSSTDIVYNATKHVFSSGNVLIGTTTDNGYKLDVSGTLHATTGIYSDGYVSAKGQNTSSDMRLKNVLNDVVLNVSDIANAPSMRFSWKNGGGVDVGSSAQYWQGLLPDAVKERDGMLEMQYANIALLSAIAIAKNVETHEERIARLEKENKELRNEIKCLRYGA